MSAGRDGSVPALCRYVENTSYAKFKEPQIGSRCWGSRTHLTLPTNSLSASAKSSSVTITAMSAFIAR